MTRRRFRPSRFPRTFQRPSTLHRTPSSRNRKKLLFEPLEARLLLSSDPFFTAELAAAGVDLALRVENDGGVETLKLYDSVLGEVASRALGDVAGEVRIVGSGFADTLRVEADPALLAAAIPGGVIFEGGAGRDRVVGPDASATWILDGRNQGRVGGVEFREVEDLLGGAGSDEILLAGGRLDGVVEGGDGEDALVGPDQPDMDNVWEVTGPGSGSLNGTAFSGVEQLTGGAYGDGFFLSPGVSWSGRITGGAGIDSLHGPDAATLWRVTGKDFGEVVGIGFEDVENLFGGSDADTFRIEAGGSISRWISGGAGIDTLAGSDAEGLWFLSGADAGTLNGRVFAGVENLAGGAGSDRFLFLERGTVGGTISGGGGADSLIALEGGEHAWRVDGFDSGSVNGRVFAGVENLVGGSGDDEFALAEGASLSGVVDGRGGVNVLDYSGWGAGIRADLGAGTATGVAALYGIHEVRGGSGADRLRGDGQGRVLAGGGGDDTFESAGGSDEFLGGEGVDTVVGPDAGAVWALPGAGFGTVGGDSFSGIENLRGGAGADTLAGPDAASAWSIEAAGEGRLNGVSFSGIENLRGGGGADGFAFAAGGSLSGTIDGGAGVNALDYSAWTAGVVVDLGAGAATGSGGVSRIQNVTGGAGSDLLSGPDGDASWLFSGSNRGSVSGVVFDGVENLRGGSGRDDFRFEDGARVDGVVDGGAGVNTLDYTAYATTVAVGLAAAAAPGTGGFRNIGRFLGGAGADDILYGPEGDAVWNVTGLDSGNVRGAEFGGFENLFGAADNEDTFVFAEGGRLRGHMDGGPAGFDSLVLEGGTYESVVYRATGPDSGTIHLDAAVVAYAGLEPITDNLSAVSRVLDYSVVGGDTLVIADGAGDDTVLVNSTASEDITFAQPSTSLTIHLGGAVDNVTINALDADFAASLTINAGGGDDNVFVNAVTGGGTYTINLQAGNDEVTLGGIAGKAVTVFGGSNDDTYHLNNAWGALTIGEFAFGGNDTLDFGGYTGTLTVAADASVTGSDGSTVGYTSQAAEVYEDAEVNLSGSAQTALLDGLEKLAGWLRSVAGLGDLGSALPIIAKSGLGSSAADFGVDTVDAAVGNALDLAESIEQLRLRIKNFLDTNPTDTTDELVTALTGFTKSMGHVGPALVSQTFNPTIGAGDTFNFSISLDGGPSRLISVTGVTSLTALRDGINADIAGFTDLVGKVAASITTEQVGVTDVDRLAIQVVGFDVGEMDITPSLASLSVLGFKSGLQTVLTNVLRGLGTLNVGIAPGINLESTVENGVPVLRLNVDFNADRTTSFNLDFGAEAESLGLTFDASATLNVASHFDFDFALGLNLDASPDFFLDVDNLAVTAKLNVPSVPNNVSADAQIGFLGIHAAGTISMDGGIGISFDNPGDAMGLTVSDLTATDLTSLNNLLDVNVSANTLALSLTVAVDPGLGFTPGGVTIGILGADVFGGRNIDLDLSLNFNELLNFNNLSRSSVIGLIGQLASWLDGLADSTLLQSIGIPLSGGALGDVLDFVDGVRDALLFDDGDDGIDGVDNTNLPGTNDIEKLMEVADGSLVPKFDTAQALKTVLNALGLVDGAVGYDQATDRLTYNINLSHQLLGIEVPSDFHLDLSPLLEIVSDTRIVLDGSAGVNVTLGFDLGAGAGTVLTNATTLAALEVEILEEPAVTGASDVLEAFGRLSADAVFRLTIDGTPYDVTVTRANTKTNTTVAHLVADLNGAFVSNAVNANTMTPTDISASVSAMSFTDPGTGNLRLKIVGAGGVASLILTASSSNPAVTELGFGTNQTGSGAPKTIQAGADLKAAVGRLSGSAIFNISIDGGMAIPVTVMETAGAPNRSIADVVSDVNSALDAAGLYDVAMDTGQIKATSQGKRLVLTLIDSGAAGSTLAAAGGNPAVTELGFGTAQTANSDDLVITLRDGTIYRVNLDGATDIGDVIDKIEMQTSMDVQVDISTDDLGTPQNEAGRNLILTDTTAGGTLFRVDATNGSAAANQLGILLTDLKSPSDTADGKIEGNAIGGTSLADRFYVASDAAISGTFTMRPGRLVRDLEIIDADEVKSEEFDFTDFVGQQLKIKAANGFAGGTYTINAYNSGTKIATLTGGPALGAAGESGGVGTVLTGIDALARFGFVGITLSGGANSNLTGSVSLGFDGAHTAAADMRITLAEMLEALDEGDLDALLNAPTFSGSGTLTLDVGIDPSFGEFSLLGMSPAVNIVVNNLGDPFPMEIDGDGLAAPDIDITGLDSLGNLGEFGDLQWEDILQGLLDLAEFLGTFEAFDFLDTPLPLINRSVNDLLGFVEKFADAVEEVQDNPAATLQFLESKIKEALGLTLTQLNAIRLAAGLPAATDILQLSLAGGSQILRFDLGLGIGFSESLDIEIPDINLGDLSAIGLDGSLFDLSGSADLTASGSLSIDLDFGIDLNDPTKIYIFSTTGLKGVLSAAGTGLSFRAGLGPFSLTIADGSASISGTATLGIDPAVFTAGKALLDLSSGIEIGGTPILDALNLSFSGSVSGNLPTFFPTEDISVGDITLLGDLEDLFDGLIDIGDILDLDTVLSNILDFNFSQFSLFDSVLLVVDGIDLFLGGLQDFMDGSLFGFTWPLIGDELAEGARFIENLREDFVEPLRQEVEKAADMARDFSDPDQNLLSKFIYDLLGPLGEGLLVSGMGSPDSPGDYIGLDTNLDEFLLDPMGSVDLEDLFIEWDIALGSTLVNAGADIGFDLGIPGLGLTSEGKITLTVEWLLQIGFGISFQDGFYLKIGNPAELLFDIQVDIPATLTGTLGFLKFTAADDEVYGPHAGTTGLGGTFSLNLKNTGDAGDQKLGFAEFGRLGVDAGVAAEAAAELALTLEFGGFVPADVAAGFPSLHSDFVFLWEIGNRVAGPSDTLSEIAAASTFLPVGGIGNAIEEGLKLVEFQDITLDLGSFVSDVLGPIVDTVQDITEPIQPIIDILTAPFPILKDLGVTFTLLDLADLFGTVDAGMIKAIADIITLINRIPDPDEVGSLMINFGDMTVYETLSGSFTPNLWDKGLNLEDTFDNIVANAGELLNNLLPGGVGDVLGSLVGEAADIIGDLRGGEAGGGFTFPILEDQMQVFGVLMGKDAVLVAYDMAPFVFEFEWSQFFSIFGPLGISINITMDVTIDFAFGYDTFGIRRFVDSGFRNPLLLLEGFFVSDTDMVTGEFGTDVPEIVVNGGVFAAAELNLAIARAGVAGGAFLTLDFNLFDPNRDGRVRITEIVGSILNQLRAPNEAERFLAPLAPFDVHGEIFARLFAFLKIDLFLFEIDLEFDITPPITLLEFDIEFFRPPILAAELDNGNLLINTGKSAKERLQGDTRDLGETITIATSGAGKVMVTGFGDSVEYGVNSPIVIDGGEGDDTFDLSGVTDPNVTFEIDGGAGNDTILLGTGNGTVHGGLGDDTITGGAGDDVLVGGLGNDSIQGGGGKDLIFADDERITEDTVRGDVQLTDGNDVLAGGNDSDILIGSGGADDIDGGPGDDLIVGDAGLLTFTGSGVPQIAANVSRVERTETGAQAFGDTIRGSGGADSIYGGKGDDDIEGGSENDTIWGQAGFDTIDAGTGNDVVFGDNGTFNSPPVATAGGDPDTIYGGGGEDTLLGADGGDYIEGGDGDDEVIGGPGPDTLYGDGVTAGPGDGDDLVRGEGDPDTIYGGSGPMGGFRDTLDGGAGRDEVWGDNGPADFNGMGQSTGGNNDFINAFIGSDIVDGQGGDDTYFLKVRGGGNSSRTEVFDSGASATDSDLMQVTGTVFDDQFLLRAAADPDGLAFVALINSETEVERIDYTGLERLVVLGSLGDDRFHVDNVRAEATLDGGVGNDFFQIGQLYRTPRTVSSAMVDPDDEFATIHVTRGYLSEGITLPMTVHGGVGEDEFVVFHNLAVLTLNGGAGDDTFTVRAFALFGSQENERDRTDITGGEGADFVQYAVNAPVNIDGGDGLDTVIVIGTEFGDDFVITKDGIFGAGLNVNFVNIEALRVDGAEGDDRFFVLSTGAKFATQIAGGLGSDTFNMSGDTPPIISNDLTGHSGIVAHSLESMDADYSGLKAAGISAEIADNEEPGIVVTKTRGSTVVTEAGETDTYTVVLTREPTSAVVVQAAAPVPTQEDQEMKSRAFRVWSPDAPLADHTDDGTSVSLTFTAADWDTPKTVKVEALDHTVLQPGDPAPVPDARLDYNDDASEGPRFGVVNHIVKAVGTSFSGFPTSVSGTAFTDAGAAFPIADQGLRGRLLEIIDGTGVGQQRLILSNTATVLTLNGEWEIVPDGTSEYLIRMYDGLAVPSILVRVNDNERAGLIVNEADASTVPVGDTDSSTDVIEGGLTDKIEVRLTRAPTGTATVGLTTPIGQLGLSSASLNFTNVTFGTPQEVTVSALDDMVREGFHHGHLNFGVTAAMDTDQVLADMDMFTIPDEEPEAFVGLEHVPSNPAGVTVTVNAVARPADRFQVIHNKILFTETDGDPEFLTGMVNVSYSFVEPGFNGFLGEPVIANVADNDAPGLLVRESFGSTDVIEGGVAADPVPLTDTYTVVLTMAPDQNVTVQILPKVTKTTRGVIRNDLNQVKVSSTAPGAVNHVDGSATLTFTPVNWATPQTVKVVAADDGVVDGGDTKVFAPALHTVADIQGPITVEGAGGEGSLAGLGAPVMLPGETNVKPATGDVVSLSGTSLIVNETEVLTAEDVSILDDLLNRTVEITEGPGVGQFRLIIGVIDLGTTVRLVLNEAFDLTPGEEADVAKYAVTKESLNFFVKEETRVDLMAVNHEDSVADSGGVLTDRRLTGFLMGPDLVIGGELQNGGITYNDLEVVLMNMGMGAETLEVKSTHTREDGFQTWTIIRMGGRDDTVTLDLNAVDEILASGTATGGSATMLVDAGAAFPTMGDGLAGQIVRITGGTGEGQTRRVASNTATAITPDRDWETAPDATSAYEVIDPADGRVAIHGQAGDDSIDGSASTLPLVMFGDEGDDTFLGGAGADILFGDRGRVDYVGEGGAIVTRLGAPPDLDTSTPQRELETPVDLGTGKHLEITGATATTITDANAHFPTADGGLAGLSVRITNGTGVGQRRQIASNTGTTLTVTEPWDILPVAMNSTYRVFVFSEDQTDGVIRDPHLIVSIDPSVGGDDEIHGNAGDDTAFGGAADDTILTGEGDDAAFGDSGRLVFHHAFPMAEPMFGESAPTILDLVESTHLGVGGSDTMSGNAGSDFLFGGAAGDEIYGDDVSASAGGADGPDTILGDNGEVILDGGVVAEVRTTDVSEATGGSDLVDGNAGDDLIFGGVNGSNDTLAGGADDDVLIGDDGEILWNLDGDLGTVDLVRTVDTSLGGGDTISGNAGDDLILGGKGGDRISGNEDDDVALGDFGRVEYAARIPMRIETTDRTLGGADTMYGGAHEDVLAGGAFGDAIDGDEGDDLIFGDNVLLDRTASLGKVTNPRFRALLGTRIYDLEDAPQQHGTHRADPAGVPVWTDWEITLRDHSFTDEALDLSNFGDDYIAGGAANDQIFAQLGDDVVQGDGGIESLDQTAMPVGAFRDGSNLLQVAPSFEAMTDGDDYIEGNGGDDTVFGNLGQDDVIGGSSDLFSLVDRAQRPDGSDLLFGGAGTDIARGDFGDLTSTGHGRDADVIAADNANVYRLVGTNGMDGGAFLTFQYDNYSMALRIVPRAVELLDYTPGGADFDAAGQATDIGAGDEAHGESGDDSVYGMVGPDVLFGEGQDDDLIGGYGLDWASGGTGEDGILGDDGRIWTSRNTEKANPNDTALAEPLYGIAKLEEVDQRIDTPGDLQVAILHPDGALKKTANLTPFHLTPMALADDPLYDPLGADDILYGGFGDDFVHAGAGDDAVSGAEALPRFYDAPDNPGNVLRYGQERAGEFAAYDEFDPLRKIFVDADGVPTGNPADTPFLLNFDAAEGPLDATFETPGTPSDGNDALFGDLGNDWIVGGTGRDNAYGGWGDDLLNADDDHDSTATTADPLANDVPDTDATYEDRAFGGAGRDVLIGNTGGDRLIDWVGEFNSYLVPFAPFGTFTISRSLQPHLMEFLYDLSAADGADPTRPGDSGGDPLRNGEPDGEIGLVLQKDFAWQDQTGAPADPQPGNVPGGPRDVLQSADFNDNSTDLFTPDVGTWSVERGRYVVAPTIQYGDAVSVFYVDDYVPNYFEVRATINADKNIAGLDANAYLIFDYIGPTDFKFAGVNPKVDKLQIGHRTADGWIVDVQNNMDLWPGRDYNLLLALNGTNATLLVDGTHYLSHTFAPRVDADGFTYGLNAGMVGLGAHYASGRIDNVAVQVLPPEITLAHADDFTGSAPDVFTGERTGTWRVVDGRYEAAPEAPGGLAMSIVDLGLGRGLAPGSVLDFQAVLNTRGMGGFVFDAYGPEDFKFVAIDALANRVVIGHHTARHGWRIDAGASQAIVPGADYRLDVSLRGTSVSVAVDGRAVTGFVFNALLVDGGFGLIAANGASSFDSVGFQTDDPAFLEPAPAGSSALLASGGGSLATEDGSGLDDSWIDGSDGAGGTEDTGSGSILPRGLGLDGRASGREDEWIDESGSLVRTGRERDPEAAAPGAALPEEGSLDPLISGAEGTDWILFPED